MTNSAVTAVPVLSRISHYLRSGFCTVWEFPIDSVRDSRGPRNARLTSFSLLLIAVRWFFSEQLNHSFKEITLGL